MKLNQQVIEIRKDEILSHSSLNIFYGFSGSLNAYDAHAQIKIFNTLGVLVETIPVTQKDFDVEVNLTQKGLCLVALVSQGRVIQQQKWVVW